MATVNEISGKEELVVCDEAEIPSKNRMLTRAHKYRLSIVC